MRREITALLGSSIITTSCLAFSTIVANADTPDAAAGARARLQGEKGVAVVARDTVELGDGELSTLFREAAATLREFTGKRISQEELARARCIAVFPQITGAGVVAVGGFAGDGVAVCRNNTGAISQVAFVDISGQTVGPQLGGRRTRAVVLIDDPQAEDKIERGAFDLSAQAGAVGPNSSHSARTDSRPLTVYSEEEGLFAGATVGTSFLKVDKSKMEAFYKEPATVTRTLSTFEYDRSKLPSYVEQFVIVLPPKVSL